MPTMLRTLLTLVIIVLLAGCGGPSPAGPVAPQTGAAKPAALPDGLILTTAPASAKDVKAAKVEVKEGDEIVIRGQVGGSANHSFSPDRAMLTIVDMALKDCSVNPDDKCETPWDFCCDAPEVILENLATIQVLGPDGKTIKAPLKGVNGIDHLSVLVVKGTVAKRDDPKNLVVNATGIFVEKAKTK